MATKQKQNPCFSTLQVLPIFLFFLQLLLNRATSSDSLSFNFANFGPDVKDIIFQGHAIQSNGTLQLTEIDDSGEPVPKSAGRALFSAPIHLWEKTTGRLASFYTSFTFLITPPPDGSQGHGLTFFIAPPDSEIPRGSYGYGGLFALFSSETALNTTFSFLNQIVAVEFDTFSDTWDPNFPHIGIDVNSVKSVATAAWGIKDVPHGSVATAEINYDSVSKIMRASLSYPNAGAEEATVSAVVDLRSVVAEWVRVGFSSSNGGAVETNNVLSWSFTSYMDGNMK